MRRSAPGIAVVVALAFVTGAVGGCKDPASDVAHATTTATTTTATTPTAAPSPTAAGPVAPPAPGTEILHIAAPQSTIGFVGSKVTGSHEGSFGAFSGSLQFVPAHVEASRITVDIDMNALTTPIDPLTNHLKSPAFFDVAHFPHATFVSTSIRAGAPPTSRTATHTIVGNLTLHGETRAITFPATITVTPGEVTATSAFSINRREFGINFAGAANDLIRDDVVIRLAIHAPRHG